MRERLTAWYFTGPVGHFVAGFTDWVELLVRLGAARVMRRVRRQPER